MSVIETEVVVIGAGPGGYPAAFGCADHGKQVVMVDQDPQPGGVCLNRGCIPSKALLHLSKLIEEAKEASHAGVSFGPPQIDLAKVRDFKNGVINRLVGGIGQLAQARAVKFVQARARFQGPRTLALSHPDGTTSQLKFQTAILATGSSPAVPPPSGLATRG